jgi:hypothetical protein
VADRCFVVPVFGELGLARLSGAVPVPSTAGSFTIQDVCSPVVGQADVGALRPMGMVSVLGGVPSGLREFPLVRFLVVRFLRARAVPVVIAAALVVRIEFVLRAGVVSLVDSRVASPSDSEVCDSPSPARSAKYTRRSSLVIAATRRLSAREMGPVPGCSRGGTDRSAARRCFSVSSASPSELVGRSIATVLPFHVTADKVSRLTESTLARNAQDTQCDGVMRGDPSPRPVLFGGRRFACPGPALSAGLRERYASYLPKVRRDSLRMSRPSFAR